MAVNDRYYAWYRSEVILIMQSNEIFNSKSQVLKILKAYNNVLHNVYDS